MCPHFQFGDVLIKTISLVASFSAVRDTTLDDLSVELIYPADDESEAAMRSLSAEAGSGR